MTGAGKHGGTFATDGRAAEKHPLPHMWACAG